MTIHVVLGTGAVGTHLVHHLAAQGHQVRAVNRSGSQSNLPASVEVMAGDLSNPAFASAALKGARVAYQLTQPAYTQWAAEFPTLQESILDAASQHATRVVLADNLYPYGDPRGVVIHEGSPEEPHTRKGKVRKMMADAALRAHAEGRVEVTLSRPSNYVGPGYAITQDMVFSNALAGKPMRWLGRTDTPHSYSYVPDVATAMAALGSSEDAWGKVWIAPTMEPITVAELSRRVWHSAGQSGKPKVQALSGLGLKALALVNPVLKESKEMMYEYDLPYVADASAICTAYGLRPTSWDTAISESLEAARTGTRAVTPHM